MKALSLLVAALGFASPAAAQIVKLPDNPPSPQQVLASATPDAAALFTVDPARGLVHRASGYACPATDGSAALMSIGAASGVAACQYADSFGPVIRVEFLPREAGEAISKAYCEALPKTFGIDVGPPFPGARRMEGPSVPPRMGEVLVQGKWTPIRQCIWGRAPFKTTDLVIYASALQPDAGWAARLVLTPARPAKGRTPYYSLYDELRPIFMLGAVVAGEDAPHR